MSQPDSDRKIVRHIEDLIGEEHRLRAQDTIAEADRDRIAAIEVQLDQCWDLLRQRRARREFGQDPDQAHVRPADVVEKYEG